jgi:hypothetical protein
MPPFAPTLPAIFLFFCFFVVAVARHRPDRYFLAVAAVAVELAAGAFTPYETGLHLFVDTEGLAEMTGVELKQHQSVNLCIGQKFDFLPVVLSWSLSTSTRAQAPLRRHRRTCVYVRTYAYMSTHTHPSPPPSHTCTRAHRGAHQLHWYAEQP